MDDLIIDNTRSLFEIFIDLSEIYESIENFRKEILELLKSKNRFPDLDSILNKTNTYETFLDNSKILENMIKYTITNFYCEFKKDLFSKYNIEELEKFIEESFGFLFTLENFKILRKFPQNRIKKILYEDNSIYTGQFSKNNFNKEIREGFGYYKLFPSKEIFLGIFENDNFRKGVFIKNSNNFYIGKFIPIDNKFYKFDGMTISLSQKNLNISFGSIDIKNKISKGDFFLMEDEKIEYFYGELVNDEKSSEEGLLISSINIANYHKKINFRDNNCLKDKNDFSEIAYTIIKGEFLHDIPVKKYEILKPEFHVTNIETEGNSTKPIKGFVEFAFIDRSIFCGEVEFDDYSFFPSNKGNILFEKNTFYKGEFLSGKRSGRGIYLAFKNENKYLITEGIFQEDQLNTGRIFNDVNKFKFNYKEDSKQNIDNDNKLINESMVDNKDNLIENYVFDGSFANNQFKRGTLIYGNGDKYVGEFLDNKRHGEGTYFYINGSYYKGEWKYNLKHGKGKYYDKTNNMLVQGEWENNKIDNLFHAN